MFRTPRTHFPGGHIFPGGHDGKSLACAGSALAGTVLVAATALITVAGPAAATAAPASRPAVFSYVGEAYQASSRGASAVLPVANPHLASRANHSLAEIAVESPGGGSIAEVGWVHSHGIAGGPRLFVSYWTRGATHVDSGFRSTSAKYKPFMTLRAGTSARFGLRYRHGSWNVYFRGSRIGYFPERDWSGGFRKASIEQAFGEVESYGYSRTEMIDGRADRAISGFRLAGARTPAGHFYSSERHGYHLGAHGATWFRLGGRGRLAARAGTSPAGLLS
jgi:hypothetical protein